MAQLLLDRRQVDPRAFAADQTVPEVEDVEKAGLDGTPTAVQPERVPGCGRVQDRFVYDVALAIPAADGLEAVYAQFAEERAVEAGDLVAAVKRVAGAPDDVVLRVVGGGRILETSLTPEGERRLAAATPAVRRLEEAIEADLSPAQGTVVKSWLVETAQRLEDAR